MSKLCSKVGHLARSHWQQSSPPQPFFEICMATLTCSHGAFSGKSQKAFFFFFFQNETPSNENTGAHSQSQTNVKRHTFHAPGSYRLLLKKLLWITLIKNRETVGAGGRMMQSSNTAMSLNLFRSAEEFLCATWGQQWTPRRMFNSQSSSQWYRSGNVLFPLCITEGQSQLGEPKLAGPPRGFPSAIRSGSPPLTPRHRPLRLPSSELAQPCLRLCPVGGASIQGCSCAHHFLHEGAPRWTCPWRPPAPTTAATRPIQLFYWIKT